MREIKSLTAIRGLAALGVVFYHAEIQIGHFYAQHKLMVPTPPIEDYIFVDLFFILSGFIVAYVHANDFKTNTPRSYGDFLKMRLVRIYPIHVFVLATLFALELFYLHRGSANMADGQVTAFSFNTWPSFVENLFLVQTWGIDDRLRWNIVSWSISAEWAAYLLTPLLFQIFLSSKKWLTASGLLAATAVIVCIEIAKGTIDTTYDFGVFRCLAEYGIGVFGYRLYTTCYASHDAWRLRAQKFLPCLIVLMLASIFVFRWELPSVVAFALLIPTLALANTNWIARIMSADIPMFLGRISYSLYMIHLLVITKTVFLTSAVLSLWPEANFWELVVFKCCAAILAAIAVYYAVEKPLRALGRNYLKLHQNA